MPAVSEHDRPADLRDASGRYPPGGPTPPASQPASLTDAPAGRPRRGARRTLVVREHDALTGLHENERRELERFAFAQATDADGERRPVLALRNGVLYPQNCVGIIETRRGTVIEILPKIDLANVGERDEKARQTPGERTGGSADSSTGRQEETRRVFLTMLRDWRGLGQAQLDAAGIRAVCRFDMLEAFVHTVPDERHPADPARPRPGVPHAGGESPLPAWPDPVPAACPRESGRPLPVLRRLRRVHLGSTRRTRLLRLALRWLTGVVRHPANRQRVHQLRIVFSAVPPSTNLDDDWARHRVDRSMRHYDTVMPWVELFLFGKGLATFAGPYVNRALLFPMEEVFEDFVTAAVRRHQRRFTVHAQGPMRHLATDGAGRNAFWLKPDIVLKERRQVRFILDAKWKHLDPAAPNHGVSQDDAYQLFAYGKRYGCRRVVLVYPRTPAFHETLKFRFVDDHDLEMACFPFNVADSAGTVGAMMRDLLR